MKNLKTALLTAAVALAIAVPNHAHAAAYKPLSNLGQRLSRDTTNGAHPTRGADHLFKLSISGVLNGLELGDIVGRMTPAEREQLLEPGFMDTRTTGLFCVPKGTTFIAVMEKLVAVVGELDKQHPELGKMPAQIAVWLAAAAKFPCHHK